jgi:hypothetical protein
LGANQFAEGDVSPNLENLRQLRQDPDNAVFKVRVP